MTQETQDPVQLMRLIVRQELEASQSVGFINPMRRTISIERNNVDGIEYCWGFFEPSGVGNWKFIGIPETTIRGFITGVGIKTSNFDGKDTKHLIVHVDCGPKLYRIKSGIKSVFSRGLIWSMDAYTKEEYQTHRFDISVKPGDGDGQKSKKVVLSSINCEALEFRAGKGEFPKDDPDTTYLRGLFKSVAAKVGRLELDNDKQSEQG